MYWSCVRAVPLAAVIPSQVPAVAGCIARVRVRGESVRRVNQIGLPTPGGDGADRPATSHLAAGQESGSCRPRWWLSDGRLACRSGQAAELPVAQAVEDQGEQSAGGDLGDIAGFLPGAGR